MIDPVAALVGLLTEDSALGALVGDRIYGNDLPESPVFPALVVRLVGGEAEPQAPVLYPEYEIAAYGETDSDAADVNGAVYDFLTGLEGTNERGFKWVECDMIGTPAVDPDWPEWRIVEAEYSAELINEAI